MKKKANNVMRNLRQGTLEKEGSNTPSLQQIMKTMWELQRENMETRRQVDELQVEQEFLCKES